MLAAGVCRASFKASRKAVESMKGEGTKLKAEGSDFGRLENGVPSNPWGTGLRMEYCSVVRRRRHFIWWKYYLSLLIIRG